MSSNVSTPLLEPLSSQQLAPPSPSPLATKHAADPPDGLDDIPPLSLDVLTSRHDKVEALKLVADSIAQQRQRASLNLVFHPLLFGALALALGAAYQYTWVRKNRDLGMAMALMSGVVMTYLLAIRFATSGYIHMAEGLGWDFLRPSPPTDNAANNTNNSPDDEDIVIGTRFGKELIGALVLRLEPSPSANVSPGRRRGNRNNGAYGAQHLKGGKGIIRAWTTKLRYRRRGVGTDMLHEAVRITRERCGKDAEVGFAAEHANSTMILPDMFNRPFRKREMQAAKALDAVLGEWEGNRRKR